MSTPASEPQPAGTPASSPSTGAGHRRSRADRATNLAPNAVTAASPRGLALRLFVYVVAGHLLAAFLFLLFELGGGK
ncbi:DUF6126 family protein [Streptomyces albus]|uniref:DUF6126 family protein n=1 Tax=Streptomyces albus TaxID=1888 RepID=UPI0024E17B5C|nr:DUF6126 family protein [Streptomyces albus]